MVVECSYCLEQFRVDSLDERLPTHYNVETEEVCCGSGEPGLEVDLDADIYEADLYDPDIDNDGENDSLEM